MVWLPSLQGQARLVHRNLETMLPDSQDFLDANSYLLG